MYRRTGIVVLLVAAAITAWLLWLPVRSFIGYSIGGEDVSQIYLPCGSALGVFAGNFDAEADTASEQRACVKEGRSRAVYIAALDIPLLIVGISALARGPYPNRKLGDR